MLLTLIWFLRFLIESKLTTNAYGTVYFYKKNPISSFLKKSGSLRIHNWLLGCREQDINNWNMEWKFVKTHTVRFCGLDWCRPCRQGSLFIRHNTFSQTILFSCPVVHYVILYFIYSHDLPTYWKVIITNHMIWHSDLNLKITFGNCAISIWCT